MHMPFIKFKKKKQLNRINQKYKKREHEVKKKTNQLERKINKEVGIT